MRLTSQLYINMQLKCQTRDIRDHEGLIYFHGRPIYDDEQLFLVILIRRVVWNKLRRYCVMAPIWLNPHDAHDLCYWADLYRSAGEWICPNSIKKSNNCEQLFKRFMLSTDSDSSAQPQQVMLWPVLWSALIRPAIALRRCKFTFLRIIHKFILEGIDVRSWQF